MLRRDMKTSSKTRRKRCAFMLRTPYLNTRIYEFMSIIGAFAHVSCQFPDGITASCVI